MLALDSTLGCIEVSGPDVLDLYSSAPVVVTQQNGSRTESREAYVCAIRKQGGVRVYVALVADNRRIFVYTNPGEPDPEQEYHHTLLEALDFARSQGFAPERVNLDYSPAMREVVVRNTKILRPPGSKVHALLRHGTANAPTSGNGKKTHPKKAVPPGPPAAPAMSPALTPLPLVATAATASPMGPTGTSAAAAAAGIALATTAGLATAVEAPQRSSLPDVTRLQEALRRLTGENRELQQRAREEVATLTEKLAQTLADRHQEREQLDSVRAELLKSEQAREGAQAEAQASLKGELATVSAGKAALSAQVQELAARLQAVSSELEAADQDRLSLRAENDLLGQRLTALEATSSDLALLQREVSSLTKQLVQANQAHEKLAADNAQRMEAWSVAQQETASLVRERDQAQQQAEQLATENATAAAQGEALRAEIAEITSQRDALRLQVGKLQQEKSGKTAEVKELRKEMAALAEQRDAARLGAERAEGEYKARETEVLGLREELATLAAQLDAARTRGGNPAQTVVPRELTQHGPAQQTEAPHQLHQEQKSWPGAAANQAQPSEAGLPDGDQGSLAVLPEPEEASLPWAGELHESVERTPEAGLAHRHTSVAADWYQTPKGGVAATDFSSADDDFFPAEDECVECPGRFLLNPTLPAIGYGSPDEVIELQRSINLAYLSPDGRAPASCQGYICGLKTAQGLLRVLVALFSEQGGKTWVYCPELQPENGDDYLKAVTAAVGFAEGVGFLMEPVPLGPTGDSSGEAFQSCPVLRATEG